MISFTFLFFFRCSFTGTQHLTGFSFSFTSFFKFLFHQFESNKLHTSAAATANGGIKSVAVVDEIHSDCKAVADNVVIQNNFL